MRTELALLAVVAACKGDGDAAAPKARAADVVAGALPPLAAKAFYRIDLAKPPACSVGATCEAELVLTALGDYHVNERYPVKLEVEPGSVEAEGTGTFVRHDKTGTLAVKLRPTQAGAHEVRGTFKLSVCTEANCEIEAPKIAFSITAK
jgi:hypothetical protein